MSADAEHFDPQHDPDPWWVIGITLVLFVAYVIVELLSGSCSHTGMG